MRRSQQQPAPPLQVRTRPRLSMKVRGSTAGTRVSLQSPSGRACTHLEPHLQTPREVCPMLLSPCLTHSLQLGALSAGERVWKETRKAWVKPIDKNAVKEDPQCVPRLPILSACTATPAHYSPAANEPESPRVEPCRQRKVGSQLRGRGRGIPSLPQALPCLRYTRVHAGKIWT